MRIVVAQALVVVLLAPVWAQAACLALSSHPDGAQLDVLALPDDDTSFAVVYVHSVTRSPVTERYRISGGQIVETEMRFEQHGPGLPTEADAGETFAVRDGRFVVTMNRRFPAIVMQVHADQSPRLIAGGLSRDLAQWGNRPLVLSATAGSCAVP